MRIRALLLIVVAVGIVVSCRKPPGPAARIPLVPAPHRSADSATYLPAAEPVPVKMDASGFKDVPIQTIAFRTEAHRHYLGDSLVFSTLPDQGLPEGATAVVGSKVCRFYPGAMLSNQDDLERLPTGIPVPFATILPITGGTITDAGSEHEGMFSFQDNWNWFYPTRFQGMNGLVFGADLYGLGDSNENNRISALLYRTAGKSPSFHPILGYKPLSSDVTSRLERDRLAIQEVRKDEYQLWVDEPDDMISLYLKHDPNWGRVGWSRKTPVFVTTDLAAHAQHLVFDRLLQYLEEVYFVPRLRGLVTSFLVRLNEREPKAETYRETLKTATRYFQVAEALLALAPERVESTDRYDNEPVRYLEKDRDAILADYPEDVRRELGLMDAAQGVSDSAVFSFANGTTMREDYSQYAPRGHYTKNGVLATYFRAMMWFGRIHFLIAREGKDPLPGDNGLSSDSLELTLAMEPIALLLTDLVRDDAGLYGNGPGCSIRSPRLSGDPTTLVSPMSCRCGAAWPSMISAPGQPAGRTCWDSWNWPTRSCTRRGSRAVPYSRGRAKLRIVSRRWGGGFLDNDSPSIPPSTTRYRLRGSFRATWYAGWTS